MAGPKVHVRPLVEQAAQGGPADHVGAMATAPRRGHALSLVSIHIRDAVQHCVSVMPLPADAPGQR